LVIGNLRTTHNLILAPLAGISNYPFRQICRDFGADFTFTEMVSIDGLLYNNDSSLRLLKIFPQEQPIGFQLFGSNEEIFKKVVPQILENHPAVIDLNFGCPVRKVVSRGAGAAFLKNLTQLQNIVNLVKSISTVPVMAKIRLGWDSESIVVAEAAQAVASGGADAITVHARTRSQGYSGKALWEYIARVKELVEIPVIGNGDVFDEVSAQQMFSTTGVDGIMLARGTLGNPWIFLKVLQYLQKGQRINSPDIAERFTVIDRHYQMEQQEYGEELALKQMRKHFGWYLHGLPHAAKIRNQIFKMQSYTEIKNCFNQYMNYLNLKNHVQIQNNNSDNN
jgi:nifR3 family TIM-barrel protein